MKLLPVCIDAYAALTAEGLVTPDGLTPWSDGQSGPQDVSRAQVLATLLPSFGKLMLPDRLAFSAASLMMTWYRETLSDSTGVCIGLPVGSLSTDLQYSRSVSDATPSPAIFSATLPSSPVSEIAIFYKYKGPNRVFAGGDLDGICALDEAVRLVATSRAEAVVVVDAQALELQDTLRSHLGHAPGPNRALALLVRRAPGIRLSRAVRVEIRPAAQQGQCRISTEYFEALFRSLRDTNNALIEVAHPRCTAKIQLGDRI